MVGVLLVAAVAFSGCAALPIDLSAIPFDLPFLAPTATFTPTPVPTPTPTPEPTPTPRPGRLSILETHDPHDQSPRQPGESHSLPASHFCFGGPVRSHE